MWLDQIRDGFRHPTSDSFAAYADTLLGEDDGDDFVVTTDPTREEVIVLSSEGSDRSREGLIPRSPCAGPAQGVANEPMNEPVGVDADPPVETAEQLQTRKNKKLDKSEKKEKKVEENVTGAPRKQPFNHLFLYYVVVSDTLSGLGAGEKRSERDPNDDETLTEIMKKKKVLEDKKKNLDEQAATALAAKNSKLQKETPPVPSESEIDLGVFSAKRGAKSGKSARKFDISKITPPTSPPSRTFGLSPPHSDSRGKEKKDEVEQVENVAENIAGAGGDGDGRCEGLMGEDTLDFEAAKKAFAEEKEKFNAEKKGLSWRVADAEEKLQSQCDAIVRLSGKKRKISDEAEQVRAVHQKREQECIQRMETIAESKASKILVEEVTADFKWLLAHAVPLISECIAVSEELAKYMYELGEASYDHGRKDGYAEGRRQEFESLEFAIVKAAGKLSRKPNRIALLKRALGEEDREAGGAGTNHQQ
ncbi:hypothetical protein Hdeb2414_s0010g00349811 [Helianthus debilis subsp. tardiflorus]